MKTGEQLGLEERLQIVQHLETLFTQYLKTDSIKAKQALSDNIMHILTETRKDIREKVV